MCPAHVNHSDFTALADAIFHPKRLVKLAIIQKANATPTAGDMDLAEILFHDAVLASSAAFEANVRDAAHADTPASRYATRRAPMRV